MAKTWQRLRGNQGGFKPQPWHCCACDKVHAGSKARNQTLDGRVICDRAYDKELAVRFSVRALEAATATR